MVIPRFCVAIFSDPFELDITLKLLSSSDCRPPDDLQLVARVISNNGIIESKPAMMSTRNSWTLVVKSDLWVNHHALNIS